MSSRSKRPSALALFMHYLDDLAPYMRRPYGEVCGFLCGFLHTSILLKAAFTVMSDVHIMEAFCTMLS